MEEFINMDNTNLKNDYESNLNNMIRDIAIEDGIIYMFYQY